MMMGQNWGMGWSGMWFGWLMMIGLAIAVVVLIVWLVRLSAPGVPTTSAGSASSDRHPLPALEILQARYARGEISKEEYLDARATLQP